MNRQCYWWVYNNHIAWPRANWTWSECEIVFDCIKWVNAGSLWKNANWKWSECSGSIIPPIPIIEIGLQPPGLDATTLIPQWLEEPWNPYRAGEKDDKRKRLIRLICKINGQEYNEEKMIKNFKVTANDIKMVVKEIAGIDLDLKMEE